MSKMNRHKQISPLAVRLIGAVAATALLSGGALTAQYCYRQRQVRQSIPTVTG